MPVRDIATAGSARAITWLYRIFEMPRGQALTSAPELLRTVRKTMSLPLSPNQREEVHSVKTVSALRNRQRSAPIHFRTSPTSAEPACRPNVSTSSCFDNNLLNVGKTAPALDAGEDTAYSVCRSCLGEFRYAEGFQLGNCLVGKVRGTYKRY